jgi:hypothetical protein
MVETGAATQPGRGAMRLCYIPASWPIACNNNCSKDSRPKRRDAALVIIRLSDALRASSGGNRTLREGLVVAARSLEQRGHSPAEMRPLWRYIASLR